jgi:phosphoglucosamine mutase
MITASHNKFHDNGLKIFDKSGNKLSDQVEMEIESLMNKEIEKKLAEPEHIGRAKRLEDANARYIEFVKNTFPKSKSLEGLKVVIDCANGASYISAPTILYELGAEVVKIGVNPDGFNINKECGSTDTSMLVHTVLKEKADIGFALDGDGDRLIVCDENGKIIDGDQILGLLAVSMKAENNLREDTVVATAMSNLGLEKKLIEHSIKLIRTSVGDRYIKEEILNKNLSLGGEQSGHIIMRDHGSSGDGMVTALKILSILKDSKGTSSQILNVFEAVPQKLLNFNISDKKVLEKKETKTLIESYKQELSSDGRIFERMSGTEPVLRVMIECDNPEKLDHIGEQISSYFSKFN